MDILASNFHVQLMAIDCMISATSPLTEVLLCSVQVSDWCNRLRQSKQTMLELSGRKDISADDVVQLGSQDLDDASESPMDVDESEVLQKPATMLSLTAELGELALFVSGRTGEVWWPPEVSLCTFFVALAFGSFQREGHQLSVKTVAFLTFPRLSLFPMVGTQYCVCTAQQMVGARFYCSVSNQIAGI